MTPVDRSRLPPLGPEPRFTFPSLARHRLSNGLDVILVERHEVPVVTLVLLLRVGAADDPPERPGLAALTADLLDEGCGDHTGMELHDALARIGARFDTEVGADATLLTLTTLTRFAERGLELLADVALRPLLAQDDFERVRELRANRLRQLRDLPPAVADRTFTRLVYGDHPYGHLAAGTEVSLRTTVRDEVQAFWHGCYRPARATLIAVGDFGSERVLSKTRDTFSAWRGGGDGEGIAGLLATPVDVTKVAAPAAPTNRLALVHREGAAQSELRIGRVAAPRNTPDYHALLVLNMVLGGQFISRINLNLREDKGYTYGARSYFDFRRAAGPFVLEASVQTPATADAVREAFGEVQAIQESRPPTDQELDIARAALVRGYPRNFETPEQIARAVAQLALYDLPDEYFSQFVMRVSAVGREEVQRAAARYLETSRLLTVIVGDRERVLAPLSGLDIGAPAEVAAV